MSARLVHGEALATLAAMADASADVMLTDPPFSSGGRRENARSIRKSMVRSMVDSEWIAGDGMSTSGFLWTMREVGWQARRVLRPGGHVLMFIDWRMCELLASALESADLRRHPTLVWDKTYFGMGSIFRNQHEFIVHMSVGTPSPPQRQDVGNVLSFKPVTVADRDHPTEKPVDLLETLLSVVCPAGGHVIDPFMGVGTVGSAAQRLGLTFTGCELAEGFYREAYSRLVNTSEAAMEANASACAGSQQRLL